jgi:hypothetical protein
MSHPIEQKNYQQLLDSLLMNLESLMKTNKTTANSESKCIQLILNKQRHKFVTNSMIDRQNFEDQISAVNHSLILVISA